MIEIAVKKKLADFTLEVDATLPMEPVAIFGPSGSGKSSLLHTVAGLLKPDSGRIAIDGQVLFDSNSGVDIPPERRGLGLVPQDGLLFPHKTVEDNLLFGFTRVKDRARIIKLDDVVEVLEIGNLLKRYPANLSGGERQRVALGRALLASPKLLLFDEPLASVDNRLKDRILPYLQKAIAHFNLPALYVSHDHEEVTRIAKTIVVMLEGGIIAGGPYLQIIDHPQVYRAFTREGVDNVLQAKVIANIPELGYSEVTSGSANFKVPPLEIETGSEISLTISANDIILAKERPSRISTRNVIEGTVLRMADVGNLLLAHIDVGCELVVELTPEAVRELELADGAQVWVLIKSNAFRP